MNLLPASAPVTSSNVADLFTSPLPVTTHHHYSQLVIGADPTTSTTSVVAPTVGASVSVPTDTSVSDSVPHPVPYFVDTGASLSVASSCSDFTLEVSQASCGLIRSPTSVIQSSSRPASTVDPYTLITGEDIAFDLSSSDFPALNSDSISIEIASSFTKVSFDICEFGAATLTFIYSKSSSELLHVFVDPIQVDWLHWIPLPRLTPTESYYHIFGRDYFQAFALLHLIPIWIALVSALLRSK